MTRVFGIAVSPPFIVACLLFVAAAAAALATSSTSALGQATAAETVRELPTFLDDRRLQELEGLARPRIEANESRRTEKLKRKAIEADVKRKADEMRRAIDGEQEAAAPLAPPGNISDIIKPSQAVAAPFSPPAAVAPAALQMLKAGAATALTPQKPTTPCRPTEPAQISTTPIAGGRMTINVHSPCHSGEAVTISYAPYIFVRALDSAGRLSFMLDLFQGRDAPLSIVFKDGQRQPVAIGETDIDRVSKMAVVWGKPVNLDMHIFEYAAIHGGGGHVWVNSPSNAEASRAETERTKRGRGFLSFASEGVLPGHQIEVYTVWHHPEQTSGIVATALDFETRGAALDGETCGDGSLAAIPFETVALRPRMPVVRERGVISAAPCGSNLLEKARYIDEALADLSLSLN